MPQFSVRLEGSDKLRVGFNKFVRTLETVTKAKLKQIMTAAMKRSVPYNGGTSYDVEERSYKRTGNLGRSTWLENTGLTYTIRSDAYNSYGKPYSVYVIGNAMGAGQANIHRGYWTTMRNAIDLEIETVVPEIDRELQNGAEAAGL